MTTPKKPAYDVPAARKAIRLLELLCDSPEPLGIAEIARRLELNKNMVFRLVRTLVDEGWLVAENETTYRVGLLPLYHLSKPVQRIDVVAAAEGPLKELREKTGECVYLSVRDGDRCVCMAHRDSRHETQMSGRVGGRYLLHCGAPGKVLLAHTDKKEYDQIAAAGFERQTPATICDPDALWDHLQGVVRQGYAIDNEEYLRGMLCLAAPVYNYTETVVAGIGVTTLTLHHTAESMIEQCKAAVREAARKISIALGYPGK